MEDDPGLARLLQKVLQRRGFVIDIATNGEDGLAMLEATPYDLILVDYNMPFLCGIDVIRTLAARNALPPTIMVTGEGNELVAVESLKLGAADYIVKDIDMKYLELLPAVIDQVLYKQQMIKERQQMIEKMQASEERYRLLFDNNPIPCLVHDLGNLRILAVNNAAVEHYGYTAEEFLALTINELYTLEEMPRLLNVFSKLDQGTKQTGIWKHRLKDNSLIEVEITSHSLMLNDTRAHLILANDVTEQNKIKENLLRSQKLESLGVLAGGIAHDFNNLLTAIIGNLSLAKLDAPIGEQMHHHLEIAEKASSRAQSLTQQLLTFASGGAPIKKPLALRKLIEDTATFALRGTKSRCVFKFSSDLWPIEADGGQLNQVIHNLIMNANQAMPDGGTIFAGGENITLLADNSQLIKPGKYVKIFITDQGVGIPENYLEKIFDPYFTTKQKGSGLGLATCYSIIKRHDGHISVESSLGKGATFTLFLPASPSLISQTTPSAAMQPTPGTGRILVMDDEELVRDVLQRILASLGYDVECTSDGAEAISRYEDARRKGSAFDAVIMDLTVPGGMGGKEAIAKLLEIDPKVNAIVSSGYSTDPIMSEYRDYGFSGVVSKPYSIKTLSEAVHKILNKVPS